MKTCRRFSIHLHDIFAHICSLMHISSSTPSATEVRRNGEAVLNLLENRLTLNVILKGLKRKTHLLVRQILTFGVMGSAFHGGDIQSERVAFRKAVEDATNSYLDNDNAKSIFKRAGTSAIECLLHSMKWLDDALDIDERCEVCHMNT